MSFDTEVLKLGTEAIEIPTQGEQCALSEYCNIVIKQLKNLNINILRGSEYQTGQVSIKNRTNFSSEFECLEHLHSLNYGLIWAFLL